MALLLCHSLVMPHLPRLDLTLMSGLTLVSVASPVNGTAARPSIPPRNITTIKLVLRPDAEKAGLFKVDVTNRDVDPARKTRREVIILLTSFRCRKAQQAD